MNIREYTSNVARAVAFLSRIPVPPSFFEGYDGKLDRISSTFPLAGLLKAGIEPKRDFKTVIFTGAHDANAVAVANGKVDAATIADRILDAAIAKGHIKADAIQIVWRSAPIPESPMVWRKDLTPEIKAKVKTAFLAIKDMNWSDQGKLNGFKETSDQAYDVVRETAKLANIDLKKQK